MPAKKEDEIMAEYLLKGGKMLDKTCRACGCPLFEYKGRTFCVVCTENASEMEAKDSKRPAKSGEKPGPDGGEIPAIAGTQDLAGELALTLAALCRRARSEQDPESVRQLMDAVRAGTEALGLLRH